MTDTIIGTTGVDVLTHLTEEDVLIFGRSGDDRLTGNSGQDTLVGHTGNDTLTGADGNDTLSGREGDDVLVGGAGHDILNGGEGSDWADYAGAFSRVLVDLSISGPQRVGGGMGIDDLRWIENLMGSTFNDRLYGDSAGNILSGGQGSDLLKGMGGDDRLIGGDGDDRLQGGGGHDILLGDDGNDRLLGGGGRDTLIGGTGNDVLEGGNSNDRYVHSQGDGNDVVTDSGGGNDVLRIELDKAVTDVRREGADMVLDTSVGEHVTLSGQFTGTTIENFEDSSSHGSNFFVTFLADAGTENAGLEELIVGTAGADTIVTSGGFDYVFAGAGDDEITSTAADGAYITPGTGNDTITGAGTELDELRFLDHTLGATINIDASGSGTAVFSDGEVDTFSGGFFAVTGGQGNDVITATGTAWTWMEGAGGDDLITGAGGVDYLAYFTSPEAINFTLGVGGNGVFNGTLLGTDTYFSIEAVAGSRFADNITGNDDYNELYGYNGDDTLDGAGGDDFIDGRAGDDVLQGGEGNDTMLGDAGDDVMEGGNGNDHLRGDDGSDTLQGGDGNDMLVGGNGADSLVGGIGVDQLQGGNGNDTIEGNDGNDNLVGGDGDDLMSGGEGDDRFFFEDGFGHDTITDFEIGDGLLLDSLTGIDDPGDVTPLLSQDGADTLITIDAENSIRLIGVDVNDLEVSPAAFVHFA